MYIGSPIDGDGSSDDGDSDDSRYNNEGTHQADAEDESDDSMASDASSGPSHHGVDPWGNGKYFQQAAEEEYDDNKACLNKKAKNNKTKEKQIEGKKVGKKEMVFKDGKGKAPVQGSGKVRKSYWVGKRK